MIWNCDVTLEENWGAQVLISFTDISKHLSSGPPPIACSNCYRPFSVNSFPFSMNLNLKRFILCVFCEHLNTYMWKSCIYSSRKQFKTGNETFPTNFWCEPTPNLCSINKYRCLLCITPWVPTTTFYGSSNSIMSPPKTQNYQEGLRYIGRLPFEQAESTMKHYGKTLMHHVPEGTTLLLKGLCTNYQPSSDTAEKDSPESSRVNKVSLCSLIYTLVSPGALIALWDWNYGSDHIFTIETTVHICFDLRPTLRNSSQFLLTTLGSWKPSWSTWSRWIPALPRVCMTHCWSSGCKTGHTNRTQRSVLSLHDKFIIQCAVDSLSCDHVIKENWKTELFKMI